MPRRPIANSASARACALAVSMFWKTCGPASVIPSCRESETNGSCSSSAVEAARSASALVTPPRTTIAPSSSASASSAAAAPSGSPRVSRTARLRRRALEREPDALQDRVAPALVRAGERDRDAEHVRPDEGELRDPVDERPRLGGVRPLRPAQEHLARRLLRAGVVAQVQVDPRELHRERLLHRRVLRQLLAQARDVEEGEPVHRVGGAAEHARARVGRRDARELGEPADRVRVRAERERRVGGAGGRLGPRLGGELRVERAERGEPVALPAERRGRRARAGTSPPPRAGRAGTR